jgi:hypothetical protein
MDTEFNNEADAAKSIIEAQKETVVRRLPSGLYVVLDGNYRPLEAVNEVLQAIHRRGQSPRYARGIAYDYAHWVRNAGHAGVYHLRPPPTLFEMYLRVRLDEGLSLPAAHTLLSRDHKVFKFAADEKLIAGLPYPTKIYEAGSRGNYRRFVVPDLLPQRAGKPLLILPAASAFRAHHDALRDDAKPPNETLKKTGMRISELESFVENWKDRKYGPSGILIVPVLGKGNRWRKVYLPADLAARHEVIFERDGGFLRADGVPWSEEALSAAFLEASNKTGISIPAHLLRHAYGSWVFHRSKRLFDEGKIQADPVLIAQYLLGHSSWEVTMGTYCNLFMPDDGDAYEDIGGCPIEVLITAMEPGKLARRRA